LAYQFNARMVIAAKKVLLNLAAITAAGISQSYFASGHANGGIAQNITILASSVTITFTTGIRHLNHQ
jgi:hypothetical protein